MCWRDWQVNAGCVLLSHIKAATERMQRSFGFSVICGLRLVCSANSQMAKWVAPVVNSEWKSQTTNWSLALVPLEVGCGAPAWWTCPSPLFNLARWGSMVCCLFSMHWGVVEHIEMLYYSLLDLVLRCSYCVTTTCAVHRRDPDRDFQAAQRSLCLLRLTALSAYYHYSAY